MSSIFSGNPESLDNELAAYLIGDALKTLCQHSTVLVGRPVRRGGSDIKFQDLVAARRRVQDALALYFSDVLGPHQWDRVCRVFQKRHLLAHKMGWWMATTSKKANDPDAILGRKVNVSRDEVTASISLVEAIGKRLFDGTFGPPAKKPAAAAAELVLPRSSKHVSIEMFHFGTFKHQRLAVMLAD
jgi:hypothetical protein